MLCVAIEIIELATFLHFGNSIQSQMGEDKKNTYMKANWSRVCVCVCVYHAHKLIAAAELVLVICERGKKNNSLASLGEKERQK